MSRTVATQVALLLSLLLGNPSFGQPKQPCFAFLLDGDITTVCEGRTSQITHLGNIESFAVSDDRSSVAWVTSQRRDGISDGTFATTLVELKTRVARQMKGTGRDVVSTCGGILQVAELGMTTELVSGERLTFSPYTAFSCSSDRKMTAGLTIEAAYRNRIGDLYLSGPSPIRIAAGSDVHPAFFNVSPDGSKVAWFNDVKPLCVYSGSLPAACVGHSTISDPVSVNNSGEVLVATGTGAGCDYKTASSFRTAKDGSSGDDECLGIGYWKPGMESIAFLRPIGRNPQWISPASAKLLLDWSRRTGNQQAR